MMSETKYTFVGRVIPCDPAVGHRIEPIAGKFPVVVDDELGGQTVAYCAEPPPVGARVGFRGQWIRTPESPSGLQFQIDARRWEVVPDDYDWLWQTMGLN